MSWARGREKILELLDADPPELEEVAPDNNFAERLLGEAEAHLRSSTTILNDDPPGAFQLAYDAARKSCEALLAAQGLRSTRAGGHIATADAVRAQFNGKGGMPAFGELGTLRRRRAGSEYPRRETPPITFDDAEDLLMTATEIVNAARGLFDTGRLDQFER